MAISRGRSVVLAVGLLALATLCLLPTSGRGQSAVDLKAYKLDGRNPTGTNQTRLGEMKSGKVRVKGPDEAANRAVLQEFAKNRIYRVTYESYYNLPDSGELKPRTGEQSLDVLVADLENLLLVPTPDRDLPKMTADQGEYVVEFGAALDQAVGAVFAKNPPLIVRVNAARLLAVAARSGAPAHGKTISALLTNTYFKDKAGKAMETPPEVLFYALRAAENLLAAYDPTVLIGQFSTRHSLPEGELVALVKVLEGMVVNGPAVADKAALAAVDNAGQPIALPDTTAEPKGVAKEPAPADGAARADAPRPGLTREQAAVVRYYRRAAIRALAKVRFDTVGGRGGPEARPAFTLAKVAVSDTTLSLPATPADAAEAVLGLAGMAPVATATTLNVDVWSGAMAVGMAAYAQPRMAAGDDRTLPWKVTSARLSGAFAVLKRATATTPKLRPIARPLTELCDIVTADILGPLEKDNQAGADRPSVERLSEWIRNNPPKDPGRSLYSDSPRYTLSYRAN